MRNELTDDDAGLVREIDGRRYQVLLPKVRAFQSGMALLRDGRWVSLAEAASQASRG